MLLENGEPLVLSLMPMELILMIAWNLPPGSRAPFVLTCKRFRNALMRPVSTGPPYDHTERLGLRIPTEVPLNFHESTMSDPKLF